MIESARAVADAVLYEGFLLFPYGKSALKNRLPFQFGVIMPRGYADESEPRSMRCEFVLCGGGDVSGLVRFLQIQDDPIEREIPFRFAIDEGAVELPFEVDRLRGEIAIAQERDGAVSRIMLKIHNETEIAPTVQRNEAMRGALVSMHVLLEARGGTFASLLDAPLEAMTAVSRCRNDRVFPVLVGDGEPGKQTSNMLLVSPIILYDFPRIAKASRTQTFDGTEIDELLMLSVASLSDAEKQEAREAHPYVRELLERSEALDADTQRLMHGELTGGFDAPGNESLVVAGTTIRRGSRVRVHPKGRADIWDDVVRGMTARVSAVHTDFEGKRYVAVLFDADPAADLHEWYGRSFFYGADEVEPIS